MTVCDKFKQLFKRSGKSIEELLKELNRDMQDIKIPAEEFEKKCKNLIARLIRKIPSLTETEKDQKLAEVSRGFQYWKGVNMDEVLNLAPPIKRKYEITRKYLNEYQDALRKSIKKT